MRVTELEVDVKRFNDNIESIKKYIGNKKMMPVIKANAYGTFINKNLDAPLQNKSMSLMDMAPAHGFCGSLEFFAFFKYYYVPFFFLLSTIK